MLLMFTHNSSTGTRTHNERTEELDSVTVMLRRRTGRVTMTANSSIKYVCITTNHNRSI